MLKIRDISGLVLCLVFFPLVVSAGLNLSVLPRQGGSSLRFRNVLPGEASEEEVTLRISSQAQGRYQVTQRLIEPIVNEHGQEAGPEALVFYALRGSNFTGSLYQDSPLWLGRGERVLYSSDQQGSADSFVMAYALDTSKLNAAGRFRGRVLYRLTPVGWHGTEKAAVLDISFEARESFDLEVETSSRSKRSLRLSTRHPEDKKGYIAFNLKGRLGQRYQINQRINQAFENERGDKLSSDVLQFLVESQKGSSGYSSWSILPDKPVSIYTSNQAGEGERVLISFFVDSDKLAEIPSGLFRSYFFYEIEGEGSLIKRVPIEVELESEPVFNFKVVPEQRGGLNFSVLGPGQPPIEKEIIIEVNSNMHTPYNVVQQMNQPLTNEKGQILPFENFKVKVIALDGQEGHFPYSRFTLVEAGDTLLFSSGQRGEPARFKVVYSLEAGEGAAPGDYVANISFSLLQR